MTVTITETENILTDDNAVLHKLILFNSNHIWDDVIIQLSKATGYTNVQCEQIAIIAHTKGKAVVSTGDIPKLNYINSVLKEIKLVTEIS